MPRAVAHKLATIGNYPPHSVERILSGAPRAASLHGARFVGGSYLQVTCSGDRVAKSWIYRFTLRAREMGLGSAETFGLADARRRPESVARNVLHSMVLAVLAHIRIISSGSTDV